MSIGLSLGLRLGRSRGGGGGAGPQLALNNYVGMVGASSVANGGDLNNLAQLVSGTNVAGVQFWGIVLSDGALCWGGCSATGGYTVQQVYDTHWPIMRDATPKRGFVGFFAGTNDTDALAPGGTPSPAAIATRKEIVRDFITEARANGQVPFVVAPQPNETSVEGIGSMPAWRLALIALCTEEHAIFADVYAALGDPDTGLWLSDTYTEAGNPATDLHIGPLGGPLAGQAIADALIPFRNPDHNPRLVSVGDETTNWLWQGGLFNRDSNANSRPDGGGSGLATDAWGAPSNSAAFSLDPGSGDVAGNWLVMTKSGMPGSSSAALTPTTAPGKVTLTADDVMEVAYHLRSSVASLTAGLGFKLHTVASGSVFTFYHRAIRAGAAITDKLIWALHKAPSSTDYRISYGIDIVTGNADLGDVGIAMLSLSAGAYEPDEGGGGVPAGAVLNSSGESVLNVDGGYIIGA